MQRDRGDVGAQLSPTGNSIPDFDSPRAQSVDDYDCAASVHVMRNTAGTANTKVTKATQEVAKNRFLLISSVSPRDFVFAVPGFSADKKN